MKRFTQLDVLYIQRQFVFFLQRYVPFVYFECLPANAPAGGYIAQMQAVMCADGKIRTSKEWDIILAREAKLYLLPVQRQIGITRAHVNASLILGGILLTVFWF